MNSFSSIKNLNIKYFKDLNKISWNRYMNKIGYDSPFHNFEILKYHFSTNKNKNLSCIIFEGSKPLILLPISIYNDQIIFPDKHCPIFLINKKYSNKKLLDELLNYIDEIKLKEGVKKYKLMNFPILNKNLSVDNYLDKKKNENIERLILNLKLPEKLIFNNLSKSLRKTIIRTEKYYEFFVINYKDTITNINKNIMEFRTSHIKKTKMETRSKLSWKIMGELIKKKIGVLFILKYKKKIISYLYCGTYNKFSWGWSQLNMPLDQFKTDFKMEPRHILEWKTIKYLKKNGFENYDLGDYFKDKSKYSTKELSISIFKKKFGPGVYENKIYSL